MIDSTFKNANILIVDDKEANIDVLEGFLEELGYRNFKSVTDPRLVAGLVNSFKPDLILLDLMMPYLSGFEVMAKIASIIPANSYMPILVLTADITPETRQRALSDGAKDFLSKPFDLNEMSLRIKNLLETRFLHQLLVNQNRILEQKVSERTHELKATIIDLIAATEKTGESERNLRKLNAELEHRVDERTSQLVAANKELEAFSYTVSHDLRAPLRHITGFIDILKELNPSGRTDEEHRYMDIIAGGATEMGKLIEALLSFSRINNTDLRKCTVNTSEMVNHVIKFLETEKQNRNITFKTGQIHDCEGDERLLKQVWINLISNAIKYTGKKDEAIVEIGSSSQKGEITYFVKDNGVGFDGKYAKKLFGVFKRLHKNKDFEGVGIGLAIVNSIITRHGGRCSAKGEVDKGATFCFTLPNA